MKITKCDRCYSDILPDDSQQNFEFRHLNDNEFWNLCEDCYKELKLFFRAAWK